MFVEVVKCRARSCENVNKAGVDSLVKKFLKWNYDLVIFLNTYEFIRKYTKFYYHLYGLSVDF